MYIKSPKTAKQIMIVYVSDDVSTFGHLDRCTSPFGEGVNV